MAHDVWRPRVEIKETEKTFVINCELAGVKPEDVSVEINDGVLSISGKKESSTTSDQDKVRAFAFLNDKKVALTNMILSARFISQSATLVHSRALGRCPRAQPTLTSPRRSATACCS